MGAGLPRRSAAAFVPVTAAHPARARGAGAASLGKDPGRSGQWMRLSRIQDPGTAPLERDEASVSLQAPPQSSPVP